MRRAADVRRWLRAATRRAEPLRAAAAVCAYARDPMLGAIPRRHTPLADTIEAMGQLAAAHARRFVASLPPWQLIYWFTAGLLLAAVPAGVQLSLPGRTAACDNVRADPDTGGE